MIDIVFKKIVDLISELNLLIEDENQLNELKKIRDYYYYKTIDTKIDEKRELTPAEYNFAVKFQIIRNFIHRGVEAPVCSKCEKFLTCPYYEMYIDESEKYINYTDEECDAYLDAICEEHMEQSKKKQENNYAKKLFSETDVYLNDIHIQRYKLIRNSEKGYLTGIHAQADKLLKQIALERYLEKEPKLLNYYKPLNY